jgi:hypothetical protein
MLFLDLPVLLCLADFPAECPHPHKGKGVVSPMLVLIFELKKSTVQLRQVWAQQL